MAGGDLVSLYNVALGWCRASRVNAPDEASSSAAACRLYYPGARDVVLRAYPWNAAAARAALAAGGAPPIGYAYGYPLPDDCLCVRDIIGVANADYIIEGGRLLTCLAAPLKLAYTRRIDPPAMDAALARCIAARLAADMIPMLVESQASSDAAEARYRSVLAEAKMVDAREGAPQQPDEDFTWVAGRSLGRPI